ncbi:hypothetical protein [Streptomyces pratens]|uniref:hypothetical protein n=1 Tax=Streptomyces pratens TaxID=887456 RepID=UPI0036DA95E7
MPARTAHRAHADIDDDGFSLEDGGGDVPEEDNGYVLELVDACAGGTGEGLAHDLSGGLRQGFRASSLQDLTVLTEVAQMKLDMERWDTAGPWRLSWFFCEGDITDPLDDTEDIDSSGDDLDGGSGDVRYSVSVENDGDAHIVQVVGARWGDQHVFYREPGARAGCSEWPCRLLRRCGRPQWRRRSTAGPALLRQA